MIEINLLPWRELKREHEQKTFKSLLLITLLSAASLVFLIDFYAKSLVDAQSSRNTKLQEEINAFNAEIAEIKKLKAVKSGLISRMRIIQDLQAKRTLTVHLFDELIKVLPDGVYLTEFKRENNRITLIGYSESNTNVSILMFNIQQNPWIQDPILTEIKKDKEANTSVNNEFNLSFTLKPSAKLSVITP